MHDLLRFDMGTGHPDRCIGVPGFSPGGNDRSYIEGLSCLRDVFENGRILRCRQVQRFQPGRQITAPSQGGDDFFKFQKLIGSGQERSSLERTPKLPSDRKPENRNFYRDEFRKTTTTLLTNSLLKVKNATNCYVWLNIKDLPIFFLVNIAILNFILANSLQA